MTAPPLRSGGTDGLLQIYDPPKMRENDVVGYQTSDDAPPTSIESRPFEYDGFRFTLRVITDSPSVFQPLVRYETSRLGLESQALPKDAAPYASAAEAWRHAEQQAVRWVHDRTGDGQGRF